MTCEAQHVAHMEDEFAGVPASVITETAALYDLVVMGLRTFYHFETRENDGDSLERILDRTASPVLAVPADPGAAFQRVLIAYDGSFPPPVPSATSSALPALRLPDHRVFFGRRQGAKRGLARTGRGLPPVSRRLQL